MGRFFGEWVRNERAAGGRSGGGGHRTDRERSGSEGGCGALKDEGGGESVVFLD